MQRVEAQATATGDAPEEMNLILTRMSERELLISDRVAETNVLLTRVVDSVVESNRILSGGVAAGSAIAAARSFSATAPSQQSAASPPRMQQLQ